MNNTTTVTLIVFVVIILIAGCKDSTPEQILKVLETKDGILYINGDPHIPTGVYFWPDISKPTGRNPFEDIASYGLNTLVAYYEYVRPDRSITNQPDIDEVREECDRLGIYYFIGAPQSPDLIDKSDEELVALFKATTDRVANSPHFLGWMFDEPIWNVIDFDLMERVSAAIRHHPAEQLIWINFAPVDDLWNDPDWPDMDSYAKLGDIIGFDFYPVKMGLPWIGYITKSHLEDFGWYTDQARSWVYSETPVWMIQQGYQRGDLGELPPLEDSRRPDSVETRFMTFQAIVHGASGIFYFPGSRLGGTIPFDDSTWDVYIRNTAATVQDLTPSITSPEEPETVTVSSSDISTIIRRQNGKTVIIAVNETNLPSATVTFSLSETDIGQFKVYGENRSVSVDEGSFSDNFDQYGVHIYVQE